MTVYALIASTSLTPVGCGLMGKKQPLPHETTTSYRDNYGLRIEYPEVAE